MMKGLTEGRMVHYVLSAQDGVNQSAVGEHRPAVVVKVFRQLDEGGNEIPPENGVSNLQVFVDSDWEGNYNDGRKPLLWASSVLYSEDGEPGTWHWIEGA